MKVKRPHKSVCQLTGKQFKVADLVPVHAISKGILRLILQKYPEIDENGFISHQELNMYRMAYVQQSLESEIGELSKLDKQVLESLSKNELLSKTLHQKGEGKLTLGQRMADRIATFGGSWTFIIIFFLILISWVFTNTIFLASGPFDPYPFILLNLILSCLAAIQAPIIMMSQNRQEEKDRERSQHDYQIDLKAELEVRQLNEKVDHLIMQQGQRMLEIQQIQIELLEEISNQVKK